MTIKKYIIGLTSGTFDLINVGHIDLLHKAKEFCDYLIVAINSDELVLTYKLIPPIMPLKERIKIVSELRCVDRVVIQHEMVSIEQFKILQADRFFVGDDYKNRVDIPGIKWLKDHKKIKFFPYTQHVSSSIIKERIINNASAILQAQQERTK